MIPQNDVGVYIREGFPGQRFRVVPRPLVAEALRRAATSRLVVTDCGYFPRAQGHGRERKTGLDQAIIILCVDGRGWCRLGSGRHEIESNQALIIPPGEAHAYGADEHRPWTIWWMHVTGADVADLLRAARVTTAQPVLGVQDMFKTTALVDEALKRLERDDSVPSLVAAAGAAWHLLALLAADQSSLHPHTDPVDQAQDYLRQNVGERISIADLAAIAGLSASHFSALFRKSSGASVLQYQTRLRMARARELLDTTDRPVGVIARMAGYPDAYYFSRQFRHVHGISPSDYRAQDTG